MVSLRVRKQHIACLVPFQSIFGLLYHFHFWPFFLGTLSSVINMYMYSCSRTQDGWIAGKQATNTHIYNYLHIRERERGYKAASEKIHPHTYYTTTMHINNTNNRSQLGNSSEETACYITFFLQLFLYRIFATSFHELSPVLPSRNVLSLAYNCSLDNPFF